MTIARLYRMTAAEGRGDELRDALQGLAASVRKIEGCGGVELLRDSEDPLQFTFIEKWDSRAAHEAGAAGLPKDATAPLKTCLARPPEGSYLDYL